MYQKASAKVNSILFPAGSSAIFKAQIKLFYLMLGANVLKGLIYLYNAYAYYDGDGSGRAFRLIITSLLLIAALRLFPRFIRFGIHWAVSATILHIYYRVFNEGVGSDVIAMQAILMVIVSSFYGLNARWGIFYTLLACAAPLLVNYFDFRWTGLQVLPAALNDLYIAVNFFVILMSHVYFHKVLFRTLNEKDVLNRELSHHAEARSSFLSTMAHELRTPLNSVIGIAGLLVDEKKNEVRKQHLDTLKFSADNLLALINDILDINKLDAGKIELEAVPFSCYTLLQSISASMASQLKGKSLDLVFELDPALKSRTYESDATRLAQILFNLTGNAVKFTDAGTVSLTAVLRQETGDYDLIRFEVKDTGIGMTPEQQEGIFDPFVQASKSITRQFGGTGLGLAIVKQLLDMFGSTIHLDSRPGKGTRIYFDLKLKRISHVAQLPSEAAFEEAPEFHSGLQKLSVLLAEDNMMNIYFMKHLLKRWNIMADVAENGQVAVDMLQSKHYDVILMDLQMPVMDGIESAKIIRSLRDPLKCKTWIIALTASITPEVLERIRLSGINDYLEKPFQAEDLKARLVNLLRDKASRG